MNSSNHVHINALFILPYMCIHLRRLPNNRHWVVSNFYGHEMNIFSLEILSINIFKGGGHLNIKVRQIHCQNIKNMEQNGDLFLTNGYTVIQLTVIYRRMILRNDALSLYVTHISQFTDIIGYTKPLYQSDENNNKTKTTKRTNKTIFFITMSTNENRY